MAAGLLNTVRGGANALVLAVFGAALIGLMAPSVGGREVAGRVAAGDLGAGPREALAEAYTAAWHSLLWAVAGLCAAAAVAVHLLTRTRTGPAGEGVAT